MNYFEVEALSNSFLCAFDKSPAHAFLEKEPTKSMETGTMLHLFCLEPEKFDEKYLIAPPEMKADRRLKEYKEFAESNPDKEIIFYQDFLNIETMRNNIETQLHSCGLLPQYSAGESEVEVYFQYDEFPAKAKIDRLYIDGKTAFVFDIKKTTDCSKFAKSIETYGYYRQNAWYEQAVKAKYGVDHVLFFLLAVEETAPFGAMIHRCTPEYVEFGMKCHIITVQKYREWVERGRNRNEIYPSKIVDVEKPKWLEYDLDYLKQA